MRILLIEDDPKIGKFITQGLAQAGYATDLAADGEAAQAFLLGTNYDLIISDLMIPVIDGLTLIERFRKRDRFTPILILSAKREVDDRVRGLQMGADDYLTKPFSFQELVARVQALLRRNLLVAADASPVTQLKVADVTLDLLRREVHRGSQKIELQQKEFALLELFLRSAGQVLSKNQILEKIWNYQFDPQTNVVDVLVFRLRSKLDTNREKRLIHNIRGVGYVFKED
jgi:two-component system, OmpR family, response regulator